MRERDWETAARRWAVLRQVYPGHPAPWIQGAGSHIEVGALDQAEKLLAHARRRFPENPNSLLFSAELAMRRREWEVAEEYLHRARAAHPNELRTWMKSAECAEQQGNPEKAEDFNEKARSCDTENPAPFVQNAEMAMRAGRWEQALERWEEVRARFPKLPAGYVRAAEAARELGRKREARQLELTLQYGDEIFEQEPRPARQSGKRGRRGELASLFELIWTKALFNLRSEVHRNYLSYGWWILEPLLHMVVYYVVFGILLKRGGEDYPVFLMTGLVPWMWFMKSVSGSSGSILAGQNLMLQVGLPSIVFPLIGLLQTAIKQFPVFVLLIGFVWLQGHGPSTVWWSLFPVILVQVVLTMVIACAVAALIPFIRDLTYLVPTGLMFLMFLSGVFYDYQFIAPEWQEIFLLNPVAYLLKCYREIFIDNTVPDLVTLTLWGLGSTAVCGLLLIVYGKLRYIFPRIVLA